MRFESNANMPLPRFVASLIDRLRGKAHESQDPFVVAASTPAKKKKLESHAAARDLVLSGRAPDDFSTGTLDLSDVRESFALPPRLRCFELKLANSSIQELLPEITVAHRIDLSRTKLRRLPDRLKTGTLVMQDCSQLEALPKDLAVHFLVLDGCRALSVWPESARVSLGRISARGCAALQSIPSSLGPLASLDLSGCSALTMLPQGVRVSSWLDLEGTQIRQLPESLRGVRLRWRGVTVSDKVVFSPESLTTAEILAEPNAEVRRVMLDRCGLERFLAEAHATIRDKDEDPGGQRQLVAVDLPGDEPLVCVIVHCPSTGRRYLIRVPPTVKTCREAVAWTGGFDTANDYAPLKET